MTTALPDIDRVPSPFHWTADLYLVLVEHGVLEEGRGFELIDGAILTDPPQGAKHFVVFMALQRLFNEANLISKGLMVGPTVVLSDHDVFDPEFALLRSECRPCELPRATDVLWVIEISVSSRRIDLGPKKAAYAEAGVPDYWVVDAVKSGVWAFTDPVDGEYRAARFFPAGETLTVPVLGATLDTGAIFPTSPEP